MTYRPHLDDEQRARVCEVRALFADRHVTLPDGWNTDFELYRWAVRWVRARAFQ